MKEEFVTYDLSVKLKEKGFKEKCFAYYFPKGSELIFNQNPFRGGIVEDCLYSNNSLPNECMASDFVDAPTIAQVLKWLRKSKNIHIVIDMREKVWFFDLRCLKTGYIMDCTMLGFSDTYEQAALAGIEYVIDNLI